jgi:N-acetylmuramoyl-L-alanine amidase
MADFGGIIDQARVSSQCSGRTGPITRVIWHHQASTNDDATINMMVSGSRQVSSTYTVDNKDYNGRGWARITGVVPEHLRPWTSSSQTADGQALTIEACNSSGDPTWGISPYTAEACAQIAAYAYTAYGVPLRRATSGDRSGHLGHNEVISLFGEGYATACPMHIPIDDIIARATQIINGGNEPAPLPRRNDMTTLYINKDANPDKWILAGDSVGTTANWIETTNSTLAAAWAKAHGDAVLISAATYNNFKNYYLMPVAIRGTVTVSNSKSAPAAASEAGVDS